MKTCQECFGSGKDYFKNECKRCEGTGLELIDPTDPWRHLDSPIFAKHEFPKRKKKLKISMPAPELTGEKEWMPLSEWEEELKQAILDDNPFKVSDLIDEFKLKVQGEITFQDSAKITPETDKIVDYRVDDWSYGPVTPEMAEANPDGVKGVTIPISDVSAGDYFLEGTGTISRKTTSALDVQEGGNHYKKQQIQPVEYIDANKLDYMQGCVVKYITRHKDKNGAEDIKKIKHYCDLILELQYGQEDS